MTKKKILQSNLCVLFAAIICAACGQPEQPAVTTVTEAETTADTASETSAATEEVTEAETKVETEATETEVTTESTSETTETVTEAPTPDTPYLSFNDYGGGNNLEYKLITGDDSADYIEAWRFQVENDSITYRRYYNDDVETVEDFAFESYGDFTDYGYYKWYLCDHGYSEENHVTIWYDSDGNFTEKNTGATIGHQRYHNDESTGDIVVQYYDDSILNYGPDNPVSESEKAELLAEAAEKFGILKDKLCTEEELTAKYTVVKESTN